MRVRFLLRRSWLIARPRRFLASLEIGAQRFRPRVCFGLRGSLRLGFPAFLSHDRGDFVRGGWYALSGRAARQGCE